MAVSRIKEQLDSDLRTVWETVLAVEKYGAWRSDLSRAERAAPDRFIEYAKNGYPTVFTVTLAEPYARWEFDMENSNMKGHWAGRFTPRGEKTEIDFMESVTPKKWFLRPFVKAYLKKQQAQFVADLKKALGA